MIQISVRGLAALVAAAAVAGPTFAQAQSRPAAKPAQAAKSTPAKKPAATSAKPEPASAAQAAVPAGSPNLLGQFGEWGAYTAAPAGRKLCFVIAKPGSQQTKPAGRPRDPAYFFISTRPAERVKDEISTVVGYALKPDSANAVIGSATFAMYAQNDGAWIKNAAEEARMIDAMRKGGDLVVKGTSARGTESTDTYNLRGLAQALDRVAQECK
jgi:hypothetical protein